MKKTYLDNLWTLYHLWFGVSDTMVGGNGASQAHLDKQAALHEVCRQALPSTGAGTEKFRRAEEAVIHTLIHGRKPRELTVPELRMAVEKLVIELRRKGVERACAHQLTRTVLLGQLTHVLPKRRLAALHAEAFFMHDFRTMEGERIEEFANSVHFYRDVNTAPDSAKEDDLTSIEASLNRITNRPISWLGNRTAAREETSVRQNTFAERVKAFESQDIPPTHEELHHHLIEGFGIRHASPAILELMEILVYQGRLPLLPAIAEAVELSKRTMVIHVNSYFTIPKDMQMELTPRMIDYYRSQYLHAADRTRVRIHYTPDTDECIINPGAVVELPKRMKAQLQDLSVRSLHMKLTAVSPTITTTNPEIPGKQG